MPITSNLAKPSATSSLFRFAGCTIASFTGLAMKAPSQWQRQGLDPSDRGNAADQNARGRNCPITIGP
jgi:hypothetical protein